jgi:hypothetical protein|tara:strand:- start:328 stop:435 length:108 start_codon:yes stop_codon:yes gene_type:complete
MIVTLAITLLLSYNTVIIYKDHTSLSTKGESIEKN